VTRRPRRWLLAAIAAALPLTGPGALAATTPPRLQAVVAAWHTSPVYVDPLLTWELSSSDATALAHSIGKPSVPLFVAVLPTSDDDESHGLQDELLWQLYVANGHRSGLYLTADGDGNIADDGFGYLPGFSDAADTAREDDGPLESRLATITAGIETDVQPDTEKLAEPYHFGRGSPAGAITSGLFAGVLIAVAGYWLVVLLVGALRVLLRRSFRWAPPRVPRRTRSQSRRAHHA
jgi:hypothetical protein